MCIFALVRAFLSKSEFFHGESRRASPYHDVLAERWADESGKGS